MKTHESETSGRSSPQMKTNTKNGFYHTKIHKTEVDRIATDSDYSTNSVIKNKIPLSNKNIRSEPFKVINILDTQVIFLLNSFKIIKIFEITQPIKTPQDSGMG